MTDSEKNQARDRCRKKYNYTCAVPGCTVKDENISIHHLVSLSCGGNWKQSNLCLLCNNHHDYVHAKSNGKGNNNCLEGQRFLDHLRGKVYKVMHRNRNGNGKGANRRSSKNSKYASGRKKNGTKK